MQRWRQLRHLRPVLTKPLRTISWCTVPPPANFWRTCRGWTTGPLQTAALMAVAAVATGADADTVLADVAADFPVIDALVRDPAGRDRFLRDTVPGCNTLGAAAMRAVDGPEPPAVLPAVA